MIDSLVHGKQENVSTGAELHVRDIREPLDDLFDAVRPEAVFHLAAQADVRVSVEHPVEDAEVNVLGTVRILEAARRARRAGRVRLDRAARSTASASSPRARTRRASRSPRTARRSSRARSTSARTTVSTGRGTSRCATGTSTGRGRIRTARQASSRSSSARSHAASRRRSSATALQTRDYVYVGDVARATTSTLGQDSGVFNVGTGRETSVVELYELCAQVAGSDTPAEHAPARLGELQRSFLDPERAASELGFSAMVELEDGLRATWDWIRGTEKD